MRKSDAIRIIQQSAGLFDKQLNNKKLLIIFDNPSVPSFIEIKALPRNFLHLTGVKLNNNIQDNTPERFFQKAISHKIDENDFEFRDWTTEQKLKVLYQTLRIASNAKMIGDYNFNGNHVRLQTDKLAGSVHSCMGFCKVGNYYVPNTILATDIRNEVDNIRKVLAVLSKDIGDDKYNVISSVAKNIDVKLLLNKVAPYVSIDESLYRNSELTVDNPQQSSIKKVEFRQLPNVSSSGVMAISNTALHTQPLKFSDFIKNIGNSVRSFFNGNNKPHENLHRKQSEKSESPSTLQNSQKLVSIEKSKSDTKESVSFTPQDLIASAKAIHDKEKSKDSQEMSKTHKKNEPSL